MQFGLTANKGRVGAEEHCGGVEYAGGRGFMKTISENPVQNGIWREFEQKWFSKCQEWFSRSIRVVSGFRRIERDPIVSRHVDFSIPLVSRDFGVLNFGQQNRVIRDDNRRMRGMRSDCADRARWKSCSGGRCSGGQVSGRDRMGGWLVGCGTVRWHHSLLSCNGRVVGSSGMIGAVGPYRSTATMDGGATKIEWGERKGERKGA